ncbi:MAG TPA: hypothetical protein VI548_11205 [Chitinophagaceae bacterium]|nr:hypothetical protein [Chitinophagaceae bacterium]
MTFYQLLPFMMIVLLIIFIISSIILRKNSLAIELFVEGLKNENSGNLELAIRKYKDALDEVKKNKADSSLEIKIMEKIKLLHTIMEYDKGLHFTRELSKSG